MTAADIDNRTGLVLAPHVLLDKDGEKLVTVIKGTFEQDPQGMLTLAPADMQRAIRFADEPWGDPATTPPKYPCEVCGLKTATDVVVVAKGYAPEDKPVPSFDVAVRVGPLQKSLRVFGLRVWQQDGAGLSAPRPLLEQELRYDHAWGGLDVSDPTKIVEEPRNPMGRGVMRDKASLTHQLAPCIEDPAHPIGSASSGNVPAGFGPLGPHFKPRRNFVGTADDAWLREQAPLLPLDHDPRANQCASPGLMASPPLAGGEEVALFNLVPGGGLLQFLLPRLTLNLERRERGREPQRYQPLLDTVVLDTLHPTPPGRVTVEMVWRVLSAVPRRMDQLTLRLRGRDELRGRELSS